MNDSTSNPYGRNTFVHVLVKVLCAFLLVSMMLFQRINWVDARTSQTREAPIQPQLVSVAQHAPQRWVKVIVQKKIGPLGSAVDARAIVLGGRITKDLYFIHAIAVEITAGAALQLAQHPGVRWISLDAPVGSAASTVVGAGEASTFTAWATTLENADQLSSYAFADMVDSTLGPDGEFSQASGGALVVGGFASEETPGRVVSRVEAVLRLYVRNAASHPTMTVIPVVGTAVGAEISVNSSAFDPFVGQDNAGLLYVDLTAARTWQWRDFYDLSLKLSYPNQTADSKVLIDAIGVRITSVPGQSVDSTQVIGPRLAPVSAINTNRLGNVFNQVLHATDVWNASPQSVSNTGSSGSSTSSTSSTLSTSDSSSTFAQPGGVPMQSSTVGDSTGSSQQVIASTTASISSGQMRQGDNVAIAVVDSGMLWSDDYRDRVIASVNFNASQHMASDKYGHGTFVASTAAGDGTHSEGRFMGIAPRANLVNVRISDDQGISTESDVVKGLQWILENKDRYNIRVANLSLNSSVAQSYHTSPMCAAVEVLWGHGIVVVVSAGNNGTSTLYPPANDPFVITVGATDDHQTVQTQDDTIASFSAYGMTEVGQIKPDLVAPGHNIIMHLPDAESLTMPMAHPDHLMYEGAFFKMSGTSVSAPMVAGAAALLLQDEPALVPGQVKFRLMATANKSWPGYSATRSGVGYLDVSAALQGDSTGNSDVGIPASKLLGLTGDIPVWGSVNWSSVNWSSVNWSSVNWSSVNWSSDHWGP